MKNLIIALVIVAALVGFFLLTKRVVAAGIKKGDINGDGKVDAKDMAAAERIFLGINNPDTGKPYTAAEKARADVNGDGGVDMGDVVAIERISLGLA